MTIKIAIMFNQNTFSGMLTKFFTGCYAYHSAFVDEETNTLYEMSLQRRRRIWPCYRADEVLLFDVPIGNVTREYLERRMSEDTNHYGVKDYLLFAIRPLYHLFGLSTRNTAGVICSEMVNTDIWECGGITPFLVENGPPSPCDLYDWLRRT